MTGRSRRLFSGAPPEEVGRDVERLVAFEAKGKPLTEVEELIQTHLVPHLMRYDVPGFQSMFNNVPDAGAALGAGVALAYNQGVTNWQVSPGGATLEEACCRSLCRLFGLPDNADATFMYSGTYANQQALYMALHRHAERAGFNLGERGIAGFAAPERLAVLASEDAHFSIRQAVRMLGLGEQCLIPLSVDANHRVDPVALRRTASELAGTRDVFCIVATTGTTSTGAIDPVEAMADEAKTLQSWLHVDGAYGLPFSLHSGRTARFRGIEKADSITWDPHKQLAIPVPNSVLFVNPGNEFGRMTLYSHYFNREASTEPNPGLKSPPSTRPMSALPLVTSLLHRGIDDIAAEVAQIADRIERLHTYLSEQPDFVCSHTPDTGILCFRHHPDHVAESRHDELQTFVYESILGSGERSISTTRLNGNNMLRILVMSNRVGFDDLLATVDEIRDVGSRFPGRSP